MLAEAKLAEGSAPDDEDDPIKEEDDVAMCRECDVDNIATHRECDDDAGNTAAGSYLIPDD